MFFILLMLWCWCIRGWLVLGHLACSVLNECLIWSEHHFSPLRCIVFNFVLLKLLLRHWIHFTFILCCWRREWPPTPVFLPGESPEQRSLAGYRLWGCKELDMAEQLTLPLIQYSFIS